MRAAGEETTFEFLLCMMEFDDDEAVNVFWILDGFWIGKSCFIENPIVILFLCSLFHTQHVS